MVEKPTRRVVLLDLVLTNQEGLVADVRVGVTKGRELQASHFSVPGKLMELKVKNIFRCMEDRKVIITSQQGIYKWETCA